MSEVTERLFSFSREINPDAGYGTFSTTLEVVSNEHFPMTEEMSEQDRKVQAGNRAKALLAERIITQEFAMELIHLLTTCKEGEFEELTCF